MWIDLYTVSDLYKKMEELGTGDVYAEKYLKQKLQQHYGDHVVFASSKGPHKDVVCFCNMADYIISDKCYIDRRRDATAESRRQVS